MLQNAYLLAKIGADTAENKQHFAENLQKLATTLSAVHPEDERAVALLVAWRTIASFITSAVESDPQYRLASKRSNAKVVETGSWSNIYEIIT